MSSEPTKTAVFLVVIPSIRQDRAGFDEVMNRVQATFTHPTEFHILDGSDGKPAALNRALDEKLKDHHVYVTMDDDYIPGSSWQDLILQAMEDLAKVGVFALWVGDDPHLQREIGAERVQPQQTKNSTTFRAVERGHHIAGAILCYRPEVARAVGPQPITGEKYQIWEDAWRGRRVQSLGWDLAFIEGAVPTYHKYEDPPEYDAWRAEQITLSRQNQDHWLRDSGIPDPWHLRLRRWVAKLRGRG